MPLKTICMSHSPFIGMVEPGPGVEEDVRATIAQLHDEVRAYQPDLIILIAPDHFNGFFYDMMPPFCVGARAEAIGDYKSPAGSIKTEEDLAVDFVDAMSREGFDVAVSYRMQVDHAFSQPLAALTGSLENYPVLPVFINSAAPPRPSCERTRRFGEAIGRFALATGKKVLLIGSGGLSHDPPVPGIKNAPPEVEQALIMGRNPTPEARQKRQERTLQAGRDFASGNGSLRALNEEWDQDFLAAVVSGDLGRLDAMTDDSITEKGGRAGHEVRTWIAAFSAQSVAGSYKAEVLYHAAIPEWIVGMAMARAETA